MFWIKIATICFFAAASNIYISTDSTQLNYNYCTPVPEISTSPIVAKAGETVYISLPKDFVDTAVSINNSNLREVRQLREEIKQAEERETRSRGSNAIKNPYPPPTVTDWHCTDWGLYRTTTPAYNRCQLEEGYRSDGVVVWRKPKGVSK